MNYKALFLLIIFGLGALIIIAGGILSLIDVFTIFTAEDCEQTNNSIIQTVGNYQNCCWNYTTLMSSAIETKWETKEYCKAIQED